MKTNTHIHRFAMPFLTGLLLIAGVASTSADVIRLKSGKTVEGTILFQNDEVVVIRDASGTKYQYPVSEIIPEEVQTEVPAETRNDSTTVPEEQEHKAIRTGRKVSMGISVFGGGMAMPGSLAANDGNSGVTMGGHAGADVMVGTSNLFQRRIFLGGATGFHAYMIGGKVFSYIPIMLRAEVPLMTTRHAPMLGLGIGYGIGLQKTKGGLCADMEFGWRYAYSRKGAFFMGIFADFQGTEMQLTETVGDTEYTSMVYRNLCGFGAKLAVFF